jgi:hypothetical protein
MASGVDEATNKNANREASRVGRHNDETIQAREEDEQDGV